jgi:hypothetical protein
MSRSRAKKCSVNGCRNNAHSRGYCGCHYGRIWRGRPVEGPAYQQAAPASFNLQSLERQLADAHRSHDLVVGLEGKMRWRRKIQELEQILGRDQQAKCSHSVAAGA